jgi:hypothetical protein
MKGYALYRTMVGKDGSSMNHFIGFAADEKILDDLEKTEHEFIQRIAHCHVVAETPQGPRAVMPVMQLFQQLGIESLGTRKVTGDVKESSLVVPRIVLPSNGHG